MNIRPQKKIVLGNEYDDHVRCALRTALMESGATGLDRSWGVGGSQEIETVRVWLGNYVITIESETYVGLSISGPKSVVENLAQKVLGQCPD